MNLIDVCTAMCFRVAWRLAVPDGVPDGVLDGRFPMGFPTGANLYISYVIYTSGAKMKRTLKTSGKTDVVKSCGNIRS